MSRFCSLFLLVLLISSCKKDVSNVGIQVIGGSPQVDFAISQLRLSLKHRNIPLAKPGSPGSTKIVFSNSGSGYASSTGILGTPVDMQQEAFSIRKITEKEITIIYVIGGGEGGAMYGGLELAEQIRIGGLDNTGELDQHPFLNIRGVKINTSFDDHTKNSKAQHQNIPEIWNFSFWQKCIDELALHRYNLVTVSLPHPLQSMGIVPDYVNGSQGFAQPISEELLAEVGILSKVDSVNKIPIDDKIEYWRKVMKYAKDRNIDFFIEFKSVIAPDIKDKLNINEGFNRSGIKEFLRQSIKLMFLSYPDLVGIDVVKNKDTGRNEHGDSENWVFDTYGMGMLDVTSELRYREMILLYPQHHLSMEKAKTPFDQLIRHPNIKFLYNSQYADTLAKQPDDNEFLEYLVRNYLKTIWTFQSNDSVNYGEGSSDYIKEILYSIPPEVSQGWQLASDRWIQGRVFLEKTPQTKSEIVFSKYWYQWMLWGRIGYNPTITNKHFQDILQVTHPELVEILLTPAEQ